MTALRPGQSPPPVTTPIRVAMERLIPKRVLCVRSSPQSYRPIASAQRGLPVAKAPRERHANTFLPLLFRNKSMAATTTAPRKETVSKEATREDPAKCDLAQYGITVTDIRRNLSPAALYAEAIREDPKCDIAAKG